MIYPALFCVRQTSRQSSVKSIPLFSGKEIELSGTVKAQSNVGYVSLVRKITLSLVDGL